ncbi:MAG TPA: OsmC family protein [Caldilineaceae bacterium]|nr:OsmC family protein [Caldilineaceae bacterium]
MAKKNATVVWQGRDLVFDARLGSGYQYTMQSPAGESGGSPMEFLLAAVAGCTAMDVISILQKKRQIVHGLEVAIEGVQAETPPNVYTQVTITFVVQGEHVDPAAVERAIELSHTKYCSASAMFQRAGAEVTTTYRIQEVAPAG